MLGENIRNALKSLRSHRTRSLLTMSGVLFGMATVTFFVILAGSTPKQLIDQLREDGSNIIKITSKNSGHGLSSDILNGADLTIIRNFPEVEKTVPMANFYSKMSTKDNVDASANIISTSPDFINIFKLKLDKGEFIDDTGDSNNIVLGKKMALRLFGTNQVIGRTITIREQTFNVIGLLKTSNSSVDFDGLDLNDTGIININSARRLNDGFMHFSSIFLSTKTTSDKLVGQIKEKVIKNHKNEISLEIKKNEELIPSVQQKIESNRMPVVAAAMIALVFGGISIMNIMLLNVSERIREIGLRKALGATSWQIAGQFITESIILGLIGGILGCLLGLGSACALDIYLGYSIPALAWEGAVAVAGISLGIGLVFGTYPAIKAARQNPIESLRQYY